MTMTATLALSFREEHARHPRIRTVLDLVPDRTVDWAYATLAGVYQNIFAGHYDATGIGCITERIRDYARDELNDEDGAIATYALDRLVEAAAALDPSDTLLCPMFEAAMFALAAEIGPLRTLFCWWEHSPPTP